MREKKPTISKKKELEANFLQKYEETKFTVKVKTKYENFGRLETEKM